MPLERTPVSQDQMATWNDKSGSWIPPKMAAAPPSMTTNSAESNLPPDAKQLEEQRIKNDIAAKAAREENDADENALMEFVNYMVENLSTMTDATYWANAAEEILQNLEKHFNKHNLNAVKLYFSHLDSAKKFHYRREEWKEKLAQIDEVKVKEGVHTKSAAIKFSQMAPRDSPAMGCYKFVETMRHPWVRFRPKKKTPEDKDTSNLDDKNCLKKLEDQSDDQDDTEDDSDDESEADDESEEFEGMSFEARAKEEQSNHYFGDISRGLGGLKTKFNNIASSIRTHLKKALSDPELVNLQKIADEVNKLTKQFKKLEAKRELATKWFSTKTKMMDPYMKEILADYKQIKQEVSTALPQVQRLLPNTPLGPPKLVVCTKCASAPMTPQELQSHVNQHHNPEFEGSNSSLHLNPPKQPENVIKRPRQFSTGSYRQKSPSLLEDSDSETDTSLMSAISRRSKKKKNRTPLPPNPAPVQPQDQMAQMVQIMARTNFRMDEICGKFNPAKYSTLDILPHYKNFRMELNDLEKAMKELNFSKTEMYKKLKSRLEGAAKTLVSEDDPDQESYARAIKKLD